MRPGVRATVSDRCAATRSRCRSRPAATRRARVDARQLGQRVGAADLRDQAGRVPGRAVREPRPLHDDHVGDPELREVVGDRGADDAAADDHDPGARRRLRERFQDRRTRSLLARCSGIVMCPKDTRRPQASVADRRPEHVDERTTALAGGILLGVVAAHREADDRRRPKQRAEKHGQLREIQPAWVEIVGRGEDELVQHIDVEMHPHVADVAGDPVGHRTPHHRRPLTSDPVGVDERQPGDRDGIGCP